MLCSPLFAPLFSTLSLFAIPRDRTPNLTTITVTTNHYIPYPKYCPWPRPMHSLMAMHHPDPCTALWLSTCCLPHVHFMSTPHTALWLFVSCLPHVHLMAASCSPHAVSFHHAYHTASHLGASCISSPLYNPYMPHAHLMYSMLTPHVLLMLSLMYSSWLVLVL